MYYTKHPFLKVGLPFLAATLIGTAILVDIRKSRYESMSMRRGGIKGINEEIEASGGKRRSIKSLEEELEVHGNMMAYIQ